MKTNQPVMTTTPSVLPFKLAYRRQKRVSISPGQLAFSGLDNTRSTLSVDSLKQLVEDRNEQVKNQNEAILNGESTSIDRAHKVIMARKADLLTKMENEDDLSVELEQFLTNRLYMGDIYTSSRIVVGLEDTPSVERAKSQAWDDYLAERIAVNEFKLANPLLQREADFVSPAYFKEIPFHRAHAKTLTAITGESVSVSDMILANGSTASLELRAMPACYTHTWEVGDRPWLINNPKLSTLLSRKSYQKAYDKQMHKNVVSKIMEAIRVNSNLKSVTLAVGGTGRKMSDRIMYDLSQQPGAMSREFTYQLHKGGNVNNKLENIRGRIIDPTGEGKVMIYDFGQSVSAHRVLNGSWNAALKLGEQFAIEEVKLKRGEVTSISKPKD